MRSLVRGSGVWLAVLKMSVLGGHLSIIAGVVIGLAGCHGGTTGKARYAQKTFHLRGKIVAVDVAGGHVTVAHGEIPGFMDAMTMSYKVADAGTMGELHVGDVITARLTADYDAAGPLNYRLDQIVVVAEAKPDTKPTMSYHVPNVGDAVPDFKLLNQSGKVVHLGQYRGRVVLMTFIYTRCPLAEFCPRMSGNFAEIDKALMADKGAYAKTHLLSVSFDPKYDTPEVLRSYGGSHTGRFTDEDFAHWEFAAVPVGDLAKVEQWFDVGVTGDSADPSSIQHTVSTAVIGKDGRVVAWYPTNDWKVGEVLAQVKTAAGS